MNNTSAASEQELFQRVLTAQRTAYEAEERFLESPRRLEVIREALHQVGPGRILAQGLLRRLTPEELLVILPDLVWLASWAHGGVVNARQAILKLPRDIVMSQMESLAEPHLSHGSYDEYRRMLELYILIDPEMTLRLARRAAAHPDPDIAEAGTDFLEKLAPVNGCPQPAAASVQSAAN